MVKDILRERNFHGRQASDERLYMRQEELGRILISFKDVYARTKARVACYMAATTDKWITLRGRMSALRNTHRRKRLLKKLWRRLR